MLVRTNAQLAPIEGGADPGRDRLPGPRPRVLPAAGRPSRDRPRPAGRGAATGGARWPARSGPCGPRSWGTRRARRPSGGEARERARRARDARRDRRGPRGGGPGGGRATGCWPSCGGARQAERDVDGARGVELATYHRAKGLEWDAVFLPMLEEGSLPIRQAFDDDAALEEERRLLYVGITRARVHLALSWAEQRETRGRESRRRPSRFLDGLVPRPSGAQRPDLRASRRPRDRQLRMGSRRLRRGRANRRSSALCGRGERNGRGPTPCRRSSSPTTRRSRRSPRPDRRRSPGCAGSRAWARRSSSATEPRSWRSSWLLAEAPTGEPGSVDNAESSGTVPLGTSRSAARQVRCLDHALRPRASGPSGGCTTCAEGAYFLLSGVSAHPEG